MFDINNLHMSVSIQYSTILHFTFLDYLFDFVAIMFAETSDLSYAYSPDLRLVNLNHIYHSNLFIQLQRIQMNFTQSHALIDDAHILKTVNT